MVTEFGRDVLRLSGEEIERLEHAVRQGDLSPVMKSYEADMRAPIQSMLFGSMLRSAFIQIQKVGEY